MLREILAKVPLHRTLRCEACGSEFTCGGSLAGCWCQEIAVSDDTRAEIRRRYRECLCRSCLERWAQTTPPADTR